MKALNFSNLQVIERGKTGVAYLQNLVASSFATTFDDGTRCAKGTNQYGISHQYHV
jgi:hypothetical protein